MLRALSSLDCKNGSLCHLYYKSYTKNYYWDSDQPQNYTKFIFQDPDRTFFRIFWFRPQDFQKSTNIETVLAVDVVTMVGCIMSSCVNCRPTYVSVF